MAKRREQHGEVLPITALVRRVLDESGLSVNEYARVHNIARSTLNKYAFGMREPMRMPPKPDTLVALSNALRVPLSQVERAADASVARTGRQESHDAAAIAPRPRQGGMFQLPAKAMALSDSQQRALLIVIDAMLEPLAITAEEIELRAELLAEHEETATETRHLGAVHDPHSC